MKRIISVEPVAGYNLHLRFDDGAEGLVDLPAEAGRGLFEPWRGPLHFAPVKPARAGGPWSGPAELASAPAR